MKRYATVYITIGDIHNEDSKNEETYYDHDKT